MTQIKQFNGFNLMIENAVNDFLKDVVFIQSVVTNDNKVLIFYQEKIAK